MIHGIDISKHNGTIDWAQVGSAGIDFALIRAGYGNDVSQKDENFDANIQGALAHGLNVGVYWFSYAVSAADALRESEIFMQIINPYKNRITYPAAFDYEYASAGYYKKIKGAAPANALINQIAAAFLDSVKANGWRTALYTNLDYAKSKFTGTTLKAYDIWLADYSGEPNIPCAIQQTGSTGHVPGISGNVDMDVSFKDYASLSAAVTAVKIDTAGTLSIVPGEIYTIKTSCAHAPKLWAGTDNVVKIMHCRRDGSDDFWHVLAVGKVGSGTGIFTAVPGEPGQRRFVINIVKSK